MQISTAVVDGDGAAEGTASGVVSSVEYRHVTVLNVAGLHARASLSVLNLAKTFSSRIYLVRGRERVSATDMLQLLCLGAPEGTELVVEAVGPDAKLAVAAMAKLFEMKFYEDDMERMTRPTTTCPPPANGPHES